MPFTMVLIVASALVVVGVAWTFDVVLVQRSIAVRFANSAIAERLGILSDLRKEPEPFVNSQMERSRDYLLEGMSATAWPIPLPRDFQIQRARVYLVDNYVGASKMAYDSRVMDSSGRLASAGITSIESGVPFRALRRSRGSLLFVDDETDGFGLTILNHGTWAVTRTTTLPMDLIWQGFLLNVIVYFACFYLSAHFFLRFRYRRRIRNGLCPRCRYVIAPECAGCAECSWMKS